MAQQTAVEWFLIEIGKYHDTYLIPDEVIEQAKAMEKEQMFSYTKDTKVIGELSYKYFREEFEQYYNETYKK